MNWRLLLPISHMSDALLPLGYRRRWLLTIGTFFALAACSGSQVVLVLSPADSDRDFQEQKGEAFNERRGMHFYSIQLSGRAVLKSLTTRRMCGKDGSEQPVYCADMLAANLEGKLDHRRITCVGDPNVGTAMKTWKVGAIIFVRRAQSDANNQPASETEFVQCDMEDITNSDSPSVWNPKCRGVNASSERKLDKYCRSTEKN